MLADKDILKALQEGLLTVTPFDEKQLRPAGLSLHLGSEILVPKPVELIDMKQGTKLEYDTHQITKDKPFIIQPGQFVLGHTKEIISVSTKVGFMIEGRSTLARLGISVEQSATVVDPGHTDRPVTLEIYNCGPSPVTLYGDMSVARALIFLLSSETNRTYDTYARYAAQKTGVGKPILSFESQ